MKQIVAIALLALRNAFRSRFLLVLFGLLCAAAFLLPLAMRSDGTPEGLIRIHLAYTLGIAGFLLALASLWAGCAAVSQEADEKTLQLLLVKPVPRLRIWLGKWLALLLINAVFLALVGLVAAATLQHKLRHGGFTPAALDEARLTTLAAMETFRAPLPDVSAAVRAEYNALRTRRALPPDISEKSALDSLRRAHLARLYSIPPNQSRTWTFALPPGPEPATRTGESSGTRASQSVLIRFKCDSSVPGAAEIDATLQLQAGILDSAVEIRAMPGTLQNVIFRNFPAGARQAAVTFHNRGARNATLFFAPADGLVLRRNAGTFAGNYLRALAQLYLRLALFAAIGVTLGILFSMPVATFLSLVLILILQLSGFISAAAQVDRATFVANVASFGGGHVHGDAEPAPPSLVARATATVFFYAYRGTWLALRPLLADRTLDDLANGNYLPPRDLARALLSQGVVIPLFLALLSTTVLRRREWALPQLN